MNQLVIGKFIAQKRKEKNLTQEQLAGKISVSNKTISKWESGKCMPDYSIIEYLCNELDISIAELMDGESKEGNSVRIYDDQQMIDLLSRVQSLEKQRQLLIGIIIFAMGIAMLALSPMFGETNFMDFISGVLRGLGAGEIVIGVVIAARYLKVICE